MKRSADDLDDDTFAAGDEVLELPKKKRREKSSKQGGLPQNSSTGNDALASTASLRTELGIPDSLFVASSYTGLRDEENFADFLKLCVFPLGEPYSVLSHGGAHYFPSQGVPDMKFSTKRNERSPIWIIASMSAERCLALMRSATNLASKELGSAAKLFGRHMKVTEQADMLATRKISQAFGTPSRLVTLMDTPSLQKARVLLVDLTYHDKKNRNIATLNETKADIRKLLTLAVSHNIKIAFY
ncbi:hypothetical protein HDU93_003156 [Gonapodya sp. JEL0774]|nr:hypothetical protein HDU93_003156 [Gonapodya sp. JEL0774]